MSGGSYNYAYHYVSDMADRLASSDDVIRRAFAEHLHLVADAMHDVEWVDSGDSRPGREHEAIRRVIKADSIDKAARSRLITTAWDILDACTEIGDEA